MTARARAAAALLALLATACLHEPPASPPEFGVHVADAANDSARAHFKVTVTGTLELGIRSTIVAMERDSSLLVSTPADLVVNKGEGSAVITAADSGTRLAISPIDHADSAQATATGHSVRIERPSVARHMTARAVADSTIDTRKPRQ